MRGAIRRYGVCVIKHRNRFTFTFACLEAINIYVTLGVQTVVGGFMGSGEHSDCQLLKKYSSRWSSM
jgi:hypothetical protein